VDYFCYISQNKVDRILASFEPYEVLELAEQDTAMNSDSKSVGVTGLVSVIKGELTYGRSDTIQRNRKLKVSYAQKLKRVLARIRPNIVPFEWKIVSTSAQGQTYHFYRGEFFVQSLENDSLIATLSTPGPQEGVALLLDCSLRYFSDEPVRAEQPFITSTNFRFFKDRMKLTLETVFFLTGEPDERTFFGSPLYLNSASSHSHLTLNLL
jgi:hypothetical protein